MKKKINGGKVQNSNKIRPNSCLAAKKGLEFSPKIEYLVSHSNPPKLLTRQCI